MDNPDFRAAVQRPDDEIDLARAALLYARDAYPDLDLQLYLNQLDAWAEDIRSEVAAARDPIATLNRYLFDDLHLAGNAQFYHDPLNSYLNAVIDRRLGLPITLSVIYLEVAQRLGLAVQGVGLPGHFIVRSVEADAIRYIDPFHRGQLLTLEDCRQLVEQLSSGALVFEARLLEPVNARHILARMLNNLKNAYIQQERFADALPVVERLHDLLPDDPMQWRDLGLLLYQLDEYGPALRVLWQYVMVAQAAPDDPVQQIIANLQVRIARMN